MKIMYDNNINATLENEFELKNIKPE